MAKLFLIHDLCQVRVLKLMLVDYIKILEEIKQNSSLKWLVSRMLVITLKFINTDMSDLMLESLDKFGNDCDVLQYLVGKRKSVNAVECNFWFLRL